MHHASYHRPSTNGPELNKAVYAELTYTCLYMQGTAEYLTILTT